MDRCQGTGLVSGVCLLKNCPLYVYLQSGTIQYLSIQIRCIFAWTLHIFKTMQTRIDNLKRLLLKFFPNIYSIFALNTSGGGKVLSPWNIWGETDTSAFLVRPPTDPYWWTKNPELVPQGTSSKLTWVPLFSLRNWYVVRADACKTCTDTHTHTHTLGGWYEVILSWVRFIPIYTLWIVSRVHLHTFDYI